MINEAKHNQQSQGGGTAYALPVIAGLGIARQLLAHKDQIGVYVSELLKNIVPDPPTPLSKPNLPKPDDGTRSVQQLASSSMSVSLSQSNLNPSASKSDDTKPLGEDDLNHTDQIDLTACV